MYILFMYIYIWKGFVAADAKSWLLQGTNSVWGRRHPNARVPRAKSIPVSSFPHAPCPASWIPSLPAILTPVLRMCHLFKTINAIFGAFLSIDPVWWGNFLKRGKPLKGGQTLDTFGVWQV